MNRPDPLLAETGTVPNGPETDIFGDTQGSTKIDQRLLEPPIAPFSSEKWLESRAKVFQEQSLSKNSLRGYATDWKSFTDWCSTRSYKSLPAEPNTLTLYMVDRAVSLANASLTRAIAAISRYHKQAGHPSPTQNPQFREVMAGLRKSKRKPQVAKRALMAKDLFEILAQIPGLKKHRAAEVRDRALLAIGFTGALRRSELVGLDVEDVRTVPEGMILTLRWSKMDQAGQGVEIGIPRGRKQSTCPVTMLRQWLDYSSIKDGPIFRPVRQNGAILPSRLTDSSVALIVKRHVGHAGFEADEFSGHSLRAGLATSAAEAGQNERDIMNQTRHKSEKMVRRYIRKGSLFQGNVVSALDF